jgi:PAS domain S-box-containing protein
VSTTPSLGAAGAALPERLLLVDLRGTIVDASRCAAEWLERSRAELTGIRLDELFTFPGGSMTQALATWASSDQMSFAPVAPLAEGADAHSVRAEGCRLAVDDGEVHVLVRLADVHVLTGRFRELNDQIHSLHSEIERRYAAERELHRSQAWLTEMLEMAPHPTISTDGRGRIIHFSPSAEETFGYEAREVVGKPLEVLLPEGVQGAHHAWMEAFAGGTESRRAMALGRVIEGRRKGGELFPMEASISVARVNGKPIFTAVVQDVSERLRQQRAMEQAQRLESVGRLTGGVAHDFNNLLTIVMGSLDLVEHGVDPEELEEVLEDAREAAHRGQLLTRQLLAFARTQALDPVPTDLEEEVHRLGKVLQRALGEKVRVETPVPTGESWKAMVDVVQLDAALLNLALNARDAMPGGGRLSISVSNLSVDSAMVKAHPDAMVGDFVRIEVRDTGQGMPPEVRAHAMEPFFTTKPPGEGSGLGLSMVYGYVRQSGGFMVLDSTPNRGTSIRMYLPRASAGTPQEPDAGEGEGGRSREVLVVDDDPGIVSLVSRQLRTLGFQPVIANSSGEALTRARGAVAPLAAAVVDVVIPGEMHGGELAARLREVQPDLPVLLISGYSGEVTRVRDALNGASAFLAKPFNSEELGRGLAEILRPPRPVERPS